MIEFNRQREKTPGQIVNEFEEMLAIERERAKERQEELGSTHGRDPSGNFSQRGDEGRARDKAAEKVNADVSGLTLEVKRRAQRVPRTVISAVEHWGLGSQDWPAECKGGASV